MESVRPSSVPEGQGASDAAAAGSTARMSAPTASSGATPGAAVRARVALQPLIVAAAPTTGAHEPGSHSSESSDDGYRMSPAAARRFARRNLRRSSPTPDLVTSLVRPPSPDAFYVTPHIHARVARQDARVRVAQDPEFLNAVRGIPANPDRRAGPMLRPHDSSLDIPKRYGGQCVFDMYSLSYVGEPDPNLLCPICHDPLVDPVTTPCDHTFCYRCLRRSIASSPSGTACPIDREALFWMECFSAARLVRTQLNSLVVKCPFYSRGCTKEMKRELVESHATSECGFREFVCPGDGCSKKLRSKPSDEKCRHYETQCGYCDGTMVEAQRDAHLLTCPKSKARCESCWQLVVRSQMEAHHDMDCDGVEVGCQYQELGCPVRILRGQANAHSLACAFHPDTASGIVIRTQRDLIQSHQDLRQEMDAMLAEREDTIRRIARTTLQEISTAKSSDLSVSDRSGPSVALGDSVVVHDNRTMQDVDTGFEEIHQNLTQLEARQSMWTLNQVMPIREEVTELRNNLNMIRMHVNWLLNRSREEGRIRAAANSTNSSMNIRRDSSREPVPAMPERRRSSGTETDLPRL